MDARWKRQFKLTHTAILWLIIGAGLILATVAAWTVVAKMSEEKLYISTGNGAYQVAVARTKEEKERGLAGTKTLARNEGMLFVFGRDSRWPIWMKGMHIPLDIVWIDKDKRIVHTEHNVQPDAEPYVVYKPEQPARYVLELPAGTIQKDNIRQDDVVLFELMDENQR